MIVSKWLIINLGINNKVHKFLKAYIYFEYGQK